ncbi:MAG TPA: hypothetical protein VGL89_00375 [Candidatus Koribacter sp.]|jgi:hypothetical protein
MTVYLLCVPDASWPLFDIEVAGVFRKPNSKRKSSASRGKEDSAEKRPPTIFFFGENRELALYRADFLQKLGYEVVMPETTAQAIVAIRNVPFDAAILSYTLSDDIVKELADLIRQESPDCPLLTISKAAIVDPHVRPDAVIKALEGPRGLASVLRKVLSKPVQ